MLRAVLKALHILVQELLQLHEVGSNIVVLLLYIRELRFRGIKYLAQGLTTSK